MKLVWIVFSAWFLAQGYKCLKERNWRALVSNGGMPSAHAAVVSALSTGIYIESGFSLLFLVCVVFSLIVLNDALTVRWQTGVQASLLNQLLSEKKRARAHLSNSLGHNPSEVGVGIVLGVLWVILIH